MTEYVWKIELHSAYGPVYVVAPDHLTAAAKAHSYTVEKLAEFNKGKAPNMQATSPDMVRGLERLGLVYNP